MLFVLFIAILITLKLLAAQIVGYFGVAVSFSIILALIAIAYRIDATSAKRD
jgi:hypothetical protein